MLTAAELLGRVQRGEVFADDTKNVDVGS
eukprot:COSAG03_NODE_12131_length_560_cov_0.579176_1_plen_28_part_10